MTLSIALFDSPLLSSAFFDDGGVLGKLLGMAVGDVEGDVGWESQ